VLSKAVIAMILRSGYHQRMRIQPPIFCARVANSHPANTRPSGLWLRPLRLVIGVGSEPKLRMRNTNMTISSEHAVSVMQSQDEPRDCDASLFAMWWKRSISRRILFGTPLLLLLFPPKSGGATKPGDDEWMRSFRTYVKLFNRVIK
jgi:hypothetical protein